MVERVLEDPLFRQRYRFSPAGEALRIEIWTDPGGGVLAEHLHPRLEERYEVVEGEVTFTVDGEPVRARPGDQLVVPPGARHRFENTGARESHLVVHAEPPLELAESIEAGVTLVGSERFSAAGTPRGLRALAGAAAIARRYRQTVVLTSPPPVVQRLLFPLLARLAR